MGLLYFSCVSSFSAVEEQQRIKSKKKGAIECESELKFRFAFLQFSVVPRTGNLVYWLAGVTAGYNPDITSHHNPADSRSSTRTKDGRSELQKRIHSLIKLRNLWNPDDDDTVINQSFAQGLEALGWDRTMWVLGSKLSRQTDILSQYLRGNRLRCAIPCNGHVYYVVSGIPFCGVDWKW